MVTPGYQYICMPPLTTGLKLFWSVSLKLCKLMVCHHESGVIEGVKILQLVSTCLLTLIGVLVEEVASLVGVYITKGLNDYGEMFM